jgi:hypothetical protein
MKSVIQYPFLAFLCFIAISIWDKKKFDNLDYNNTHSGWILFAIIICLVFLNIRKKLLKIPVRVSKWLDFHILIGIFAIFTFSLHAKKIWPVGLFDQVLTLFFYLVSITGLIGYFLQKFFPIRLTKSGVEHIYEKIPDEINEIRMEAENIIINSIKETKVKTIYNYYFETLHWYFQRPRFFSYTLFGIDHAKHWIEIRFQVVNDFLNNEEKKILRQLLDLANRKKLIDYHYVLQSCMKNWLLVHAPLACSIMILIIWHIIKIYIYYI